jgi:hypothetical protein
MASAAAPAAKAMYLSLILRSLPCREPPAHSDPEPDGRTDAAAGEKGTEMTKVVVGMSMSVDGIAGPEVPDADGVESAPARLTCAASRPSTAKERFTCATRFSDHPLPLDPGQQWRGEAGRHADDHTPRTTVRGV